MQIVHQTNARVRKCTCRPLIQKRIRYAQMRSHSTLVDPNVFPMCSNVLSLDACLSKCVFYMLKCVLARRPSITMHVLHAQVCSRSTFVDPNACSICSSVLSSIQLRYLCAQMCSRPTLFDPNAFILWESVLGFEHGTFQNAGCRATPGTAVEKGLLYPDLGEKVSK